VDYPSQLRLNLSLLIMSWIACSLFLCKEE
jgi:hypothetical protein